MQGKRHGQGTYTYANGDVHVGAWADDKKHGAGIYAVKAAPHQFSGTWANGELTEGGVWKLADGSTFTGAWANN